MQKVINLFFLLLFSTVGFAQCDTLAFIDSLGNRMASMHDYPVFTVPNSTAALPLGGLHDMRFTNRINRYPYGHSLSLDSTADAQQDTAKLCIVCQRKGIRILDSIDVNRDGTKEIFLLREWYCPATPRLAFPNPYGEGVQAQYYSRYEVWDVAQQQQLFEVTNRKEVQVAVSVSVVNTYGYWFSVRVNDEGVFHLSSTADNATGPCAMGTYRYNAATQSYVRD